MELQKRPVRYYETVLSTHVNKEDSADLIVPDLFPDIGRILDAQGLCCVKEKVLHDGFVDVSGVSKISLLYSPEEDEAQSKVRKMDISIPFAHQFEAGALASNCTLAVSASLQSVDARTMNPRKIQVSVMLRIELTAYNPAELELCTDISAEESAGLQLKRDIHTAWLPVAAHTRDFQIVDELEIPGSRPPVEEILSASVRLLARDVHPLGNKAVFKGEALIKLLYTGQNADGLHSVEQELPFSQIVELEGLESNSDCRIQLSLTGVELDVGGPSGGESRVVGVVLQINAVARAWTEKQLEAVGDVYSTYYDVRPELRPMRLSNLVERAARRQNIRDVMETAHPVQSVIDTRVTLLPVEGGMDLEANAAVLYRGEDGLLHTASKRIPVPCGYEPQAGTAMDSAPSLSGEITAVGMSDGIEIRFSVDFDITVTSSKEIMTLANVSGNMDTPMEPGNTPSVVLRRLDKGDTLWELAKRHRTTRSELMTANNLDNEEAAAEGMLMLIPKARR